MNRPRYRLQRDLLLLLILAALVVAVVARFAGSVGESDQQVLAASRLMLRGMQVVADHRDQVGPPIDSADINRTGMLGAFYSPMTTTVGNLEAKRTSTNPNMAGLLVRLLRQAGVRTGDFIAVGASGSFPALILATLCAAETMGLKVGLIVSLGSSQWGANLLDLTWLEMERILRDGSVIANRTIAASIGGDLDVGRDLSNEVREDLRRQIANSGTKMIDESDLEADVDLRMEIYTSAAAGSPIRVFVNVGGSVANLGTDALILDLPPGVNHLDRLPPLQRQGVIHAMAARGIPIVHLLDLKDLAQQAGLPWDPSPLPEPGSGGGAGGHLPSLLQALVATYLAVVAAWGCHELRLRRRRRPGR